MIFFWLALVLALLRAPVEATPNYWVYGCSEGNVSYGLPFCNISLSIDARVDDLVSRLTLDEKLGILGPDPNSGTSVCNMMDYGVERLGIPTYLNLLETNSAVSAACVSENVCATNFPSPAAMAASFNRTLWHQKGEILSEELRALSNYNWHRAPNELDKVGLTGFGPNINLVRDPRWGRNSEVPSEDPLLAGEYASNMVRGMQGQEPVYGLQPQRDWDHQDLTNTSTYDPQYFKMLAGLKHYIAYSVEWDRYTFIPNITDFDLWDSYLAQFKIGFASGDAGGGIQGGDAQAVMSSYAGLNGVPAVDGDFILQKVLRGAWGKKDVIVATDCGAINHSYEAGRQEDPKHAAADALNAGTDLDFGDTYYSDGALHNAVGRELTSEMQVDVSLRRVLKGRFKVGLFDPLEQQPYTRIPITVVNNTEHHDFILEAAMQGLVLLKNENNTLPFVEGHKLAVVGPHADSRRDLFESYAGDELCFGGHYKCIPTVGEIFTRMSKDWDGGVEGKSKEGDEDSSLAVVEAGLDMFGQELYPGSYDAAVQAARDAEQVVVAVGIGHEIEYESHDRNEINLPGRQQELVLDILALNKSTVVVLINGGAVAVEEIAPHASAIIEAFYPGRRGGEVLYSAIFGQSSKFGRLPFTIYQSEFVNEQYMTSFDMTSPPGRTYRYYTNPVSFRFGSGLSGYTRFSLSCEQEMQGTGIDAVVLLTCTVRNTGDRMGDEVLLVYHSASDELRSTLAHPAPLHTLVDYSRLSDILVTSPTETSESKEMTTTTDRVQLFSIPVRRLLLTNNDGDRVLYKGAHVLEVSNGNTESYSVIIDVSETVVYPSL